MQHEALRPSLAPYLTSRAWSLAVRLQFGLRAGYPLLAESWHRAVPSQASVCGLCQPARRADEDVRHFMLDCAAYDVPRRELRLALTEAAAGLKPAARTKIRQLGPDDWMLLVLGRVEAGFLSTEEYAVVATAGQRYILEAWTIRCTRLGVDISGTRGLGPSLYPKGKRNPDPDYKP